MSSPPHSGGGRTWRLELRPGHTGQPPHVGFHRKTHTVLQSLDSMGPCWDSPRTACGPLFQGWHNHTAKFLVSCGSRGTESTLGDTGCHGQAHSFYREEGYLASHQPEPSAPTSCVLAPQDDVKSKASSLLQTTLALREQLPAPLLRCLLVKYQAADNGL